MKNGKLPFFVVGTFNTREEAEEIKFIIKMATTANMVHGLFDKQNGKG